MIVSCPNCSARYRIREDRFKGSRARITCKKCGHKFIVNKDENPPPPLEHGAPPHGFEEDDEDEVPTTVMPHGSQVVRKIRESTADIPYPHESFEPGDPSVPPPGGPTPIAPGGSLGSNPPPQHAGLKAQVVPGQKNVPSTDTGGGNLATYMLVGVFFLTAVVVATLVMTGALPLPV